jgi:lipid II:glycine glycyltransferase (peptidoglycan interpeptide bridge formation enzyme)
MPHGPVGEFSESQKCKFLELLESAKKESKTIFFRLEPHYLPAFDIPCRMRTRSRALQPTKTILIPLDGARDALLSSMHQKTRYNIRVAQKHGVEAVCTTEPRDAVVRSMISLFKETARRDRFSLHSELYYPRIMKFFDGRETATGKMNPPYIRLYRAHLNDSMLACALVLFFGDTATYVHGASTSVQRNVMAPYALHWKIIQDAHAYGYRWYDLWGIAPTDDPADPWAGVTRFKKGFGGITKEYPGATDFVFSPFLYTLYKRFRTLSRIVRALCPPIFHASS